MLLRCVFRPLFGFVTGLIFGALFLGCGRRRPTWRPAPPPSAPEATPPDADAAPL